MTQKEKEMQLIQAVVNLPPELQDWALGVLVGATMAAKHEEAQA